MPTSRWIWLAPIAAAAVVLVLLLASDEEGPDTVITPAQGPAADAPAPPFPDQESAGPGGGAVPGDAERQVVRAVRTYLEGIDARDGARVCAVLAPGAIQNLELPKERAGCAHSLDASIGYRDPRGYPVFDRARVEAIKDVTLGAGQARVTATVVTRFADRDEPSIEDDLIYLVSSGEEWRVVKPSATLYRAVGKPEAPPGVIAPPE